MNYIMCNQTTWILEEELLWSAPHSHFQLESDVLLDISPIEINSLNSFVFCP